MKNWKHRDELNTLCTLMDAHHKNYGRHKTIAIKASISYTECKQNLKTIESWHNTWIKHHLKKIKRRNYLLTKWRNYYITK